MPLERREVEASLERKGFVAVDGDHRYLVYHTIKGYKTSVWTKTSFGTGYKTIGDDLIGKMARQCGVTPKQFRELIDCPLTQKKYESILRESGRIQVPQEIVIDRKGDVIIIYDGSGHLQRIKQIGEKKDVKISCETWSDEASAKKAFSRGAVTWKDDHP
jgi:hypothetical protein